MRKVVFCDNVGTHAYRFRARSSAYGVYELSNANDAIRNSERKVCVDSGKTSNERRSGKKKKEIWSKTGREEEGREKKKSIRL